MGYFTISQLQVDTLLFHPNMSTDNLTALTSLFHSVTPGNQGVEDLRGEKEVALAECITYKLVFDTVLIGCLCLMGIVGNVLSIIIMQKDICSPVVTFLLQSLAMSDICLLTVSFILLSIIHGLLPFIYSPSVLMTMVPYIVKYGNPLGYISQSLTIWITVIIAVNRFLAVRHPLSAPSICTITKVRIQVALVVLICVAFNFPRFFQFDIVMKSKLNTTTEMLLLNETVIGEHTMFGKVYTNALYSVLVLLLPLLILVFVNSRLIMEIRAAKAFRQTMVSGHHLQNHRSLNSGSAGEENNVTFVMIIIVVVFLVCHSPDRILQIVKVAVPTLQVECGSALYYISDASNLLVIMNSSVNFFIYYFLRKRFRKILWTRICRGSKNLSDQSTWAKYRVSTDRNELSLLPTLQLLRKKQRRKASV